VSIDQASSPHKKKEKKRKKRKEKKKKKEETYRHIRQQDEISTKHQEKCKPGVAYRMIHQKKKM
jgi:hypothetical protein